MLTWKEFEQLHRDQGTWEDVLNFIAKKRGAGLDESGAKRFAMLELPPKPVADNGELEDDLADASIFADKVAVSDIDSIRWAIESYGMKGVKPKDAPTKMAWSLYLMVRAEPKSFIPQLARMITPKSDDETPDRAVDPNRTVYSVIDRMESALR